MSDADLTDLCKRIAAEHAERLAGPQAHASDGVDPLALIGRLDAYAEAVHELCTDVADDVKEELAS